jgi:hypothetical protein
MLIEILKIGLRPQRESGELHGGQWCHFRGGSVDGWAHVISRRNLADASGRLGPLTVLSTIGPAAHLVDGDRRLSVETSQQRIEGFRKLGPTEENRPSMRATAVPGDFLVVGRVANVTLGDDGQALVVDIDAGGWPFAVTVEDVGNGLLAAIEPGDRVQFEAIGLSLWDEGY